MLFIVLACNQNTKEDEKPAPCCSPPTSFHLFIPKSASEYQNFLNNKGEADKENVYFYQITENNTEKKYRTLFTNKSKNKDTDNKDEKNTSEQNTTRQTTNPNTNNQRGNRG